MSAALARPAQAPVLAGPGLAEQATARLAEGDHAGALALLRRATAAGDDRVVTWLHRALAEQHAGDRAAARQILAALERQMPDWAEPPLRLAELCRDDGALEQAIAAYERAIERDPARPEALIGLGTALLRQGAPARAQAVLLRACAAAGASWQAWDALGAALLATGDHAAALAALGRARAGAPGQLGVALRLAEAGALAGTGEATLATLLAEAAADPLGAATWAACGTLQARLGRPVEALAALEAAAALAPEDAPIARLRADTALRIGTPAEALAAVRDALALAPLDADLAMNEAVCLTRLYRYRAARETLAGVLAREGERAPVLCNLAAAQVCLGEQALGVATARRAIALAPQSHLAWRTLGNALCYDAAASGEAVLAAMREAGALAPRGRLPPLRALQALPGRRRPDPDRRLRVGLLSAMLRTHPVGWLTLAGIETLDPDGFELLAIAQPLSAHDAMQRRFRAAVAEWHVAQPDVAAQARALDLDIVLDLGGYGDLGMLASCAERLAPVQIKWVGMQTHSTGLAEMDWFITDRWETPPELAASYSERLLPLPDGYACYSPPPQAPEVATLPALARGHITFGCFNNLAKITPAVIAAWSAILRAVPRARLVLKTHQFNDAPTAAAVARHFAALGVDGDRLELRGSSPHRALMAQYADIDLVLDPFPYSGGLTTCEALWMGVPVLTLPGTTFASRHSASHLCNIGLDAWVARDAADYHARAVARAGDVGGLAALRAGLRARMKASPLCDAPRFGQHLGAALRHAWRDWCDQRDRAAAQAG